MHPRWVWPLVGHPTRRWATSGRLCTRITPLAERLLKSTLKAHNAAQRNAEAAQRNAETALQYAEKVERLLTEQLSGAITSTTNDDEKSRATKMACDTLPKEGVERPFFRNYESDPEAAASSSAVTNPQATVALRVAPRDFSAIKAPVRVVGVPMMEGEHPLSGIAVAASGDWVVVDVLNHALRVVNPLDGSAVRALGGQPDPFTYPFGIAVRPDGAGYVVSEYLKHRVKVLGPSGEQEAVLGVDHLSYPMGVAMDHTGRVVVADSQNNRLQVFSLKNPIPEMTIVGLKRPMGLAVHDGRYYVAEWETGFIAQVDACTGEIVRRMALSGAGKFLSCRPCAVAVDPGTGTMAVLDREGCGLLFLSAEGGLLGRIELDTEPKGLAFDPTGQVLVTCADSTIRVF